MANLIAVTSYNKLNPNVELSGTTTTATVIAVNKIIGVTTRATAYNTTGVTDILYSFPVNNAEKQIVLTVTETRAAVLAAANAALA